MHESGLSSTRVQCVGRGRSLVWQFFITKKIPYGYKLTLCRSFLPGRLGPAEKKRQSFLSQPMNFLNEPTHIKFIRHMASKAPFLISNPIHCLDSPTLAHRAQFSFTSDRTSSHTNQIKHFSYTFTAAYPKLQHDI